MYAKPLYVGTFDIKKAREVARLHEANYHNGEPTCSIETVESETVLGEFKVLCWGEGCLIYSPTPFEAN